MLLQKSGRLLFDILKEKCCMENVKKLGALMVSDGTAPR